MGPDVIHPEILKEPANVVAKTLLIFQQSWESREAPVDWNPASVVMIFNKGKKEGPRNDRPLVSLQCLVKKIILEVIKKVIKKHLKDNTVIGYSQHSFMRAKSCFPDFLVRQADHGKPIDVIFLEFSTGFNTVSQVPFWIKCPTKLDKHIMGWVSSWLTGQAQRVTVNGVTLEW
ncbi:hypothetical protein TURU_162481 [Turdus rufiventris]|nr:hypothetical protein TURU_162481 [Turdus rufiventris]